MKTLFLDFDGVLHCMSRAGEKPFDRVRLLEPLVDIAPFQVVISSSWRFHFKLDEISTRLGRLQPLVAGTTGEVVIGRHARYREIMQYANHHQITDWRALDDAAFEFPEGDPRVILCNPRIGIDSAEVVELKTWLRR